MVAGDGGEEMMMILVAFLDFDGYWYLLIFDDGFSLMMVAETFVRVTVFLIVGVCCKSLVMFLVMDFDRFC